MTPPAGHRAPPPGEEPGTGEKRPGAAKGPPASAASTEDRLDKLLNQCDVETFRASGPGGQHRNRRDTAVRLTHRPTGIIVTASERRSQHQNKQAALERLDRQLKARRKKRKKRIATRPTVASRKRRLEEKKRQSKKKASRKRAPRRDEE